MAQKMSTTGIENGSCRKQEMCSSAPGIRPWPHLRSSWWTGAARDSHHRQRLVAALRRAAGRVLGAVFSTFRTPKRIKKTIRKNEWEKKTRDSRHPQQKDLGTEPVLLVQLYVVKWPVNKFATGGYHFATLKFCLWTCSSLLSARRSPEDLPERHSPETTNG